VYEIRDGQVAELASQIKTLMEGTLTKEEAQGVPIIATMKTGGDWGSMQSM
jgi:DNA polymerase I-like protein with 3'-5' exonuclease and polymerase domains